MKALLQKEEIGEEENYIKLHERIRESSSTRVNKDKWINKKTPKRLDWLKKYTL